MKRAVARRRQGYEHEVEIREHRLIVDEPEEKGGDDPRPGADRAARRLSGHLHRDHDRDVRRPQGVGPRHGRGRGRLHRATTDAPPRFDVTITLGAELSDENRERLLVIAGKCPVHRALKSQELVIHDSLTSSSKPRTRTDAWTLGSAAAPAWSPAPAVESARATAGMLCAEGADVLLVARTEERLSRPPTSAPPRARTQGAAPSRSSPTSPTARRRSWSSGRPIERLGQLDVLVNNAGTAHRRDLDDVPDEDWYAAWELNVMAPMRLMRAAAPGMRERGWGRDRQRLQLIGEAPLGSTPEYSVAKAAELSLSRLYADRYAAHGVLINAICPGAVNSELWTAEGGLLDQVDGDGGAVEPGGSSRGRHG